jgi:hypothetical protein
MVYDAVPEATPAYQAVAAAATPSYAAQANATTHRPKSAAPAVSLVQKARPASKVVVVMLVNPSAVHQRATIPRHPSAAEAQVYTVLRGMIVSQVVDAVLLDRNDAGIVSAMILRERRAVRDLALFGHVTRVMSAVLPEVVRILRLRNVARTEVARKERRVARTNAVDRVDTVDRMGTARLALFLQALSHRRMHSLRLL